MKKILTIMLMVAVLVFAFAGVAAAAQNDATYEDPTAGVSPHGGYSDATNKCAVCHSVHHADDSGEMLLRSSVQNACIYCHVSANFAIKTVYAETETNYNGGSNRMSHDTSGFGGFFGCGSCHAVHGAGVEDATAYTEAKILAAPHDAYTYDETDATLEDGTTSILDGGDNQALNPALTDKQAVNAWCTRCHKYWNGSDNGDTHVMRAVGDGTHYGLSSSPATNPSSTCRDCHSAGYTDVNWAAGTWTGTNAAGTAVDLTAAYAGEENWPHFTSGDRFIDGLTAGQASLDAACLDCHSGVGTSF